MWRDDSLSQASTKDDAGKNRFQLDQTNRKLEQELAKARELVSWENGLSIT